MHPSFLPHFADERALADHQLRGLRWTVNHAYHGSAFLRARLEEAGVTPDSIRGLDDLQRLPFTTADDLREGYPFPLRAVPYEQLVRIHASSGTTGKRKILGYTRKDLEDWGLFFARAYEMAGVTPLDRVQIAAGYGLWTAGAGFQQGCERLGALAIPTGPGNLELQCEFLIDLQPTVFCGTASMTLLLAEEVHRRGIADQINVNKIIYGSERASASMRQKISELFGGAELFDIPGLTELYGPGTGIECSAHEGIHYWADYYLLEVLDPNTLKPVSPGEVGEMVVTTLAKEGAPLIRYRTRDLTRLLPERCACGSLLPRHGRIEGRTDDMFIIRGVNVYPSTLDVIFSKIPGLGSEYQVHLSRDAAGRDLMHLVIERGEGVEKGREVELTREVAFQIKHQLLVTPGVDVVEYGSLPRSERKSRRVFDARLENSGS
ncbi:MAG: phenylacetate--CoA ligase [Deltaproteobacteria bacterium]|nr:phenylacetate--CoA ligase [Deltaproteobacteria bacterium]